MPNPVGDPHFMRSMFWPEWLDDTKYVSVLAHFCPSAVFPDTASHLRIKPLRSLIRSIARHPVDFKSISFSVDNFIKGLEATRFYQEGEDLIETVEVRKRLPAGNYFVFLSPVIQTEDGVTFEGVAEGAISFARGVVTSLLGHAAAEPALASCEDQLHQPGTSYRSRKIENFALPDDHAFLSTEQLAELGLKMATHIQREHRDRAETAFRLLGAAAGIVDPSIRIINTWTALEVVSGSSGAAQNAIRKVCSSKGNEAASRIYEIRNDLVHRGRLGIMTPSDERVLKAAIFGVICEYYRLATPAL